jgi:hypothetical protein
MALMAGVLGQSHSMHAREEHGGSGHSTSKSNGRPSHRSWSSGFRSRGVESCLKVKNEDAQDPDTVEVNQ